MSQRGVYRGIYSALADDPDYQSLAAKSRLVLLTARICKQAGPAGIFRYYPTLLAAQTGLSMRDISTALAELEAADWIRLEEPILWIRNALRHDPNMHLSNDKHRKSVSLTLAELPRLQIVLDFCNYYEIDKPFDAPPNGLRYKGVRERDVAGERETRTSNPSPAAPEVEAGSPTWGGPQDLVALFNRLAPPGLARVNRLTTARRDKAKKSLREFPEREFWVRCFSELKFSRFLLGLQPGPGHEGFRGDFDWLLTRGKDGTENCVKVSEGKYRDKEM